MSEINTAAMLLTGGALIGAGAVWRVLRGIKDEVSSLSENVSALATAAWHTQRRHASADVERAFEQIVERTCELEGAIERLRAAAQREVTDNGDTARVEAAAPPRRKIIVERVSS